MGTIPWNGGRGWRLRCVTSSSISIAIESTEMGASYTQLQYTVTITQVNLPAAANNPSKRPCPKASSPRRAPPRIHSCARRTALQVTPAPAHTLRHTPRPSLLPPSTCNPAKTRPPHEVALSRSTGNAFKTA